MCKSLTKATWLINQILNPGGLLPEFELHYLSYPHAFYIITLIVYGLVLESSQNLKVA